MAYVLLHRTRILFGAWLGLALLMISAGAVFAQSAPPQADPQASPAGPQAAPGAASAPSAIQVEPGRGIPVLLGGEPVIWINAGAGPYTPEVRAARIMQRLEEIVHDRSIRDLAVTVTDVETSSELRVQGRLVMVVTEPDARVLGISR